MDTCAVYHWWDEGNDSPAYANLRAPLIVSIATLRAVNPKIPILVLDIEDKERDWRHFPKKLNFSVKKIKPNLQDCEKLIRGWRHLSRIWDVHLNVLSKTAVYVDSDIFWFKDPLPLSCDAEKFCFDGWNTGFYYYNRQSKIIAEFLKIFHSYARAAIYSEEVRTVMRQFVGYNSWHGVWDEMICTYMTHRHPELFDKVPPADHMTARMLHQTGLVDFKMLHANGLMVGNKVPKTENEEVHCRGLLGLLVRELYENINKVLDENDLRMIYSPRELAYYLPQQFSMSDVKWQQIKSEDGHYHIEKHIRPHSLII